MRSSRSKLATAAAAALLAAAALTLPGVVAGTSAQASTTCSRAYLPLPDPACQPGAYNPDVTQSTIGKTICVSGWTSTVRPPTSYTDPLKVQQIGEYGYSDTSTSDYEEDHLVPLELGGAPRDPANLWPEPHAAYDGFTSSDKDRLENKLKSEVCAGTLTLSTARGEIATDWTAAYCDTYPSDCTSTATGRRRAG
ncbi:MAG: hypothetical protein ACJ73S_32235 [Mycobacteriales bacterium]